MSNYYVTRSKLQDAQATAKKDDDKVTRDKNRRRDSKEIKKDFLVDDVDSHPLPSVPVASRSVRFGALGKAWDWVRKGCAKAVCSLTNFFTLDNLKHYVDFLAQSSSGSLGFHTSRTLFCETGLCMPSSSVDRETSQ